MNASGYLYNSHINHCESNGSSEYKSYKNIDNSIVVKSGFGATYVRDYTSLDLAKVGKKNVKNVVNSAFKYVAQHKGATGRYIGKAAKKTGIIPSNVRKPDIQSIVSALEIKHDFAENIIMHDVLSGGWTNVKKQFHRFTNGVRDDYVNFKKRIKNIASMDLRFDLKFALNRPKLVDIYFSPFNGTSQPGGDLAGLFNNKFEIWKTCCYTASLLWNAIHSDYQYPVSVYSVGGRDKASGWKAQGEWLQSRMICQQDQVEFHLAKPYVRNIEQWLFGSYSNPISIGRSLIGFRSQFLMLRAAWYNYGIEFDWSGYDASVKGEYIVAAFAWCRSLFEESVEIDRAFCYFCAGYLDKYIVTPDCNLFKITRGTPSGNAWTTIINSVVNCLLLEEIGSKYSAFAGKQFDYIVAGDDGILLFNNKVNFTPYKLVRFVKKNMDMDIEINNFGPVICEDPDKSLSFNKKVLYFNGDEIKITTQPKALFKRLCPNSRPSGSLESFKNTVFGQFSEILNHERCYSVIYTVIKNLYMNDDHFSAMNAVNSIRLINDGLYFSVKPEKLLRNDEYSVDKIHPMKDDNCWRQNIDNGIVLNWIKDNTIFGSNVKISLDTRLNWFVRQMGYPDSAYNFLKVVKKLKYALYTYGIKYAQFTKVRDEWRRLVKGSYLHSTKYLDLQI